MYTELYQFLIQHNQLSVPGIGTFLIERKSAISDFYSRKIDPPTYVVALKAETNPPSKKFFTWLSHALSISDEEAINRFNDFVFDIKKKIGEGDIINWHGVGSLKKSFVGEIRFTPDFKAIFFDQPVAAEKMLREKAEHTVRVGEEEKTSVQMTELLSQPTIKRSYWWSIALIATLFAAMFIAWFFSEHGLDVSSTANQKKLKPTTSSATHTSIE